MSKPTRAERGRSCVTRVPPRLDLDLLPRSRWRITRAVVVVAQSQLLRRRVQRCHRRGTFDDRAEADPGGSRNRARQTRMRSLAGPAHARRPSGSVELNKLQADLRSDARQDRASAPCGRAAISGIMQARVNEDPSILCCYRTRSCKGSPATGGRHDERVRKPRSRACCAPARERRTVASPSSKRAARPAGCP